MIMNEVIVTVTNRKTGEQYIAKSYPDSDREDDGVLDYYYVPVYEITISSRNTSKKWKAVRFMPFWNDPNTPSTTYRTKGFVNSGLHKFSKQAVSAYFPKYSTHNRYSPDRGAIRIRNNFLIHAGPRSLTDSGWGGAGCVEVIGDFRKFKQDIRDLAGIKNTVEAGDAIASMVEKGKLFVEVQYAIPPIFMKQRVQSP
jgi:hypothetical protein